MEQTPLTPPFLVRQAWGVDSLGSKWGGLGAGIPKRAKDRMGCVLCGPLS